MYANKSVSACVASVVALITTGSIQAGYAAEPIWTRVGHANNVAAIAVVEGRHRYIVAATHDNKIWGRSFDLADVNWHQIGPANDIVAIGTAMTESGNRMIFAATTGNRLMVRNRLQDWSIGRNRLDISTGRSGIVGSTRSRPPRWLDIGHANNVVGMTSCRNELVALTSDDGIWFRRKSPDSRRYREQLLSDVTWRPIDVARDEARRELGVTAITCAELIIDRRQRPVLLAATRSNELWYRDFNSDIGRWRRLGHANAVVSMEHGGNDPYGVWAVTRDNLLWFMPISEIAARVAELEDTGSSDPSPAPAPAPAPASRINLVPVIDEIDNGSLIYEVRNEGSNAVTTPFHVRVTSHIPTGGTTQMITDRIDAGSTWRSDRISLTGETPQAALQASVFVDAFRVVDEFNEGDNTVSCRRTTAAQDWSAPCR